MYLLCITALVEQQCRNASDVPPWEPSPEMVPQLRHTVSSASSLEMETMNMGEAALILSDRSTIQDAMASYSFFFLAHANVRARTSFFAIESHLTADADIPAQTDYN